MSTTSLQNHPSVEELFNHVDTVPLALFEHLDHSFLNEFPVFAPDLWGRTREREAPELFQGVLYCFRREIYGPRQIAEELCDELLYLQCGFDNPPSRESINRFLTDLSLVYEDVFDHLVEQVPFGDLLDDTYRIDSTDVRADPADDEATWNYDPTADSDDSEGEGDEENADDNEEDTGEQDVMTVVSTTVMAVYSSRQGRNFRLQRRSPNANRPIRRRRDASRMTRSPSKNRFG